MSKKSEQTAWGCVARPLLGGFFLLGVVSCSGPNVRLLDRPVAPSEFEQLLAGSSNLADETKKTLKEDGLWRDYRKSAASGITALAVRYRAEPTEARRVALAELCLDQAEGTVRSDPRGALGYYLDAVQLTEDGALAAFRAGEQSLSRTIYNSGVEQLTRALRKGGVSEATVPGALQTYNLKVAAGRQYVDPQSFDRVVPAEWLDFSDLKMAKVAVDGFGAAMIGHREQNEERLASEPTMPSAGYALPLNARVEFSGSEARLCLQDLMVDGTAEVAGKSTSLEGDLTAALSFYYFARKRETKKIMATLRPGKFEGSMGLFSIEPYRDDKIPLVIVHGLMSSAESWIGFINLLRADPVVRERYQILLFNYPSGNPIQRSAAELRSALASYWEFHDPKERNPSMDDAVILGHSMGGILTSMQIRDSDRDLEGAFLKRPIEELDLSDEEKQELARAFRFEANEDLTRAILIAAPHRGSEMARNPIGNLGARLIRLPFDLLDSVLGELMVVDALTDVAQEMVGRPMNSVTSLRPDNPLLTEVLELPVDDGVEVHSIIARKDPQDHLLESSDGVVAYTSAQLDKVVSELVVDDADHRSVVENPACVDEVWRLLREHCGVSR